MLYSSLFVASPCSQPVYDGDFFLFPKKELNTFANLIPLFMAYVLIALFFEVFELPKIKKKNNQSEGCKWKLSSSSHKFYTYLTLSYKVTFVGNIHLCT